MGTNEERFENRMVSAGPASSRFVRREGIGFMLGGAPYRFAGANLWHAAWLGAPAAWGGRDRLDRALDTLAALGVTNIRANASAEQSPLKNAVRPAFQDRDGTPNPDLLAGLDFFLAELGRRGMTAVLYLTNFWEWSGGMMTYLYYDTGAYVDMGDPAQPWPAFPNATAQFYANAAAVARYHGWIRTIVGRTNRITGTPYRDDPAIMAWQLANEPRPAGDTETAARLRDSFDAWVRSSAQVIKAIDPNHLVSIGSEGTKGTMGSADIYRGVHGFPEIDYCTAHVWPLNWGWVDARDLAGTIAAGTIKAQDYVDCHAGYANELGKPLVIDEFGFPRDGGRYDPGSTTRHRDIYYKLIYDAVEASARTGGPIQGSNFWAWNGEGRALHSDHRFRTGDTAWLGDPPHEPQGWYGVFDSDLSTQAMVAAHTAVLAGTGEAAR